MATVLVIEDNPANMKLAALLLHKAGHSVLCAADAEHGVDGVAATAVGVRKAIHHGAMTPAS